MRTAAVAALVLLLALGPGRAAAAPNPIPGENAAPGTRDWLFQDVFGEAIQGYTSEISALPGETVHFHVSTDPAAYYHIVIYRLGWYGGLGGRRIACVPDGCGGVSSGQTYAKPSDGWLGARWPVTDELRIPGDWVSGYYLARFVLRSGDQEGRASSAIFVVRAPAARRSPILVQVPVNTWEAYNPWGGKSLYRFPLSDPGGPSTRVSFDRPLPLGAFQTWEWEIQLVRFLEQFGYDVAYQTDVDTHRDPGSLLTHRAVVVDGHDEYWTSRIRDAFDTARDQGTNLAFVGANIGYWQVRYEDGERTVVGYKDYDDPIKTPDLQTVKFRDLTPPRPECALLGTMWNEGLRSSGDPPRDYTVPAEAAGDPWFAGTGFGAGTVLPELVGPEWDPLWSPAPAGCAKPGLRVLFHYTGLPSNADAVRYVAPSGARVFSAGSLRFAWGLDDWIPPTRGVLYPKIPGLQQFMRNALTDLTRPAAPLRLTATPGRGLVTLRAERGPDPRITATEFSRGGAVLCTAAAVVCVDRGVAPHGTYTYTAVNVDEWGRSAPATASVTIPNAVPTVVLRGPRTARRGARATFVAAGTDQDRDLLAYRWRLDGRALTRTAPLLSVRFGRLGRHVLEVRVGDGHGGTAKATLAVRVLR